MIGLMLGFSASAQTVVTGTVLDEADQPLIGATVIVAGTTQGTSSDLNGTFRLTVKEGSKIEVSFLNYKTVSFDVKQGARQNLGVIRMEPDAITMEDIVVTQ